VATPVDVALCSFYTMRYLRAFKPSPITHSVLCCLTSYGGTVAKPVLRTRSKVTASHIPTVWVILNRIDTSLCRKSLARGRRNLPEDRGQLP